MWHFVRFSTPYDMRVNESLFLGSCQNGKRVIWDCPKVFPGFIKAFHNECEGSSFNCPVTKERRDYAEKAINAFLPRQKSNKKATVFFLKSLPYGYGVWKQLKIGYLCKSKCWKTVRNRFMGQIQFQVFTKALVFTWIHHGVWKSQKKSHSMRAKWAMFTFWVD